MNDPDVRRHVLLAISSNPYERFLGIAQFAREHGWHLTIADRRDPPPDWSGDGVLIMLEAENARQRKAVEAYRRRGVKIVDLSIAAPGIAVPRVFGDNERIGRLAARHFAERGFRNVAWYSAAWTNVQRGRYVGFSRAWRGNEPLRLVRSEAIPPDSAHVWRRGRKWIVEKLRKAPKPLGVFAYSDYDATFVLNACREAGLSVPEEVSVLGVDDNVILCESQPVTLSSVRHDHGRVGYEGAALLDRLMRGGHLAGRNTRIQPSGIAVRQSTNVVAVSDPTVRRALAIIRRDLATSFGVEQVAAELGISRATLGRLFMREIRHPVGQEILRQRLARAKLMIAAGETSMEEIARATGFCSSAHLSSAFSGHLGISPRDWRKQHAKAVKRSTPPPPMSFKQDYSHPPT